MNVERWKVMLGGLGAAAETETFSQLQAAYAEGHRAYHTARHIDECLSLLDDLKHLCAHPAEVECALWFHDAIYEPISKTNEERSADWAEGFLQEAGAQPDAVSRVRSHIMATRHVAVPLHDDSRVVVEIDLAILGADASRYAEFERDVRREYKWVPGILYRSKRAEILQSFLDRPRIYHSEPMFERFEQTARFNLSAAVRTLTGR
jgi:predicted metal-dependent HD superfamily phosphohydrolase